MTAFTLITLVLVGVYFVWLAFFGLRRHRHLVQGPWLFFFRAFFPNWKFYHAAGKAPRLYVRAQGADGAWGDWQRVYARMPWRAGHVLHNPVVNLALNHQNLVDHLWSLLPLARVGCLSGPAMVRLEEWSPIMLRHVDRTRSTRKRLVTLL